MVRLYLLNAEGTDADAYREVATSLGYWFMPQIFFYGLTALIAALLNARRRFTAFAFAPVLNNVVVIAALLLVGTVARTPDLERRRADSGLVPLLGLGTTLGVVAMTAAMRPALRRAGIRLRWNFDLRHPGVRQVVRLSGWTIGYVVGQPGRPASSWPTWPNGRRPTTRPTWPPSCSSSSPTGCWRCRS